MITAELTHDAVNGLMLLILLGYNCSSRQSRTASIQKDPEHMYSYRDDTCPSQERNVGLLKLSELRSEKSMPRSPNQRHTT
jgi:hypothetical protein